MDGLSLKQALVDFEVANARVIDLTRRLVALHEDNVRLTLELDQLRQTYSAEKALWDEMKTSRAFKLADRVWAMRNAMRI